MGMAASQARLLSITARIHDVEFQAQDIMGKKLGLATQKDELYERYNAALDATKIQISLTGNSKDFVDATFDNVCNYNPNRTINYALTDADTGKMIVSQEIYDAYKAFQGGDKYVFALQMMGFDETDLAGPPLYMALVGLPEGNRNQPTNETAKADESLEYAGGFLNSETGLYDGYVLMTSEEAAVYENHKDDSGSNNLSSLMSKFEQVKEKGDRKEVQKAIDAFRTELYSKYAGEIYDSICTAIEQPSIEDFDTDMKAEFQYYVELFEGIESMGGCIPIGKFAKDGETNNEWFNESVKSGRVILNQYVKSGTKKGWNEIGISTSTNVQETKDETDLKKAEAEYDHELDKLNRKETKYDQDLNKLETERSALTKEMDSVKKVKEDNIERTFKIFS